MIIFFSLLANWKVKKKKKSVQAKLKHDIQCETVFGFNGDLKKNTLKLQFERKSPFKSELETTSDVKQKKKTSLLQKHPHAMLLLWELGKEVILDWHNLATFTWICDVIWLTEISGVFWRKKTF